MSLTPRMDALGPPRQEERRLVDLIFRNDLQIRALPLLHGPIAVNEEQVTLYIELEAAGIDLGPLIVVDTPEQQGLVADGNHRGPARIKRLGSHALTSVLVYTGTEDDARMIACEANAGRGLSFTAADAGKVAAVYLRALFAQGVNPTDTAVTELLGISRSAVARARATIDLEQYPDLPVLRTTMRNGQTFQLSPPTPVKRPAPVDDNLLSDLLEIDDVDATYAVAAPSPPPPPRFPRPPSPQRNGARDQDWRDTGPGIAVRARDNAPSGGLAVHLTWTYVDPISGAVSHGDARDQEGWSALPQRVRLYVGGLLAVAQEQEAEVEHDA